MPRELKIINKKTYLLIALIVLFFSLIAGDAHALKSCGGCSTWVSCQYATWYVDDWCACDSSCPKYNVVYTANDSCSVGRDGTVTCPSPNVCSSGSCVPLVHCSRCGVTGIDRWVEFDTTDPTCYSVIPSTNPVTSTCHCGCTGWDGYTAYDTSWDPACVASCTPSPTCSSAGPDGWTTTATAGTQAVYAYGVNNATAVRFPTWSDENGQDDIIWYPGTDQGGGTWKADINLASHPGIGTINVHVYLYNNSFSNIWCDTANGSRSALSCPSLPTSYPSSTWDRVWCDKSFVSKLADTPEESTEQFSNDWGNGVVVGIRADDIGFRSGRTINLPVAGTYTFSVGSDDGVKVWIDSVLVLDKWYDRGYAADTFTLSLTAGNHQFRVDYYENGGSAGVSFGYTAPVSSIHCSRCGYIWDHIWVEFDSTDATCLTVVPSTNPVTRSCNCTCLADQSKGYYQSDTNTDSSGLASTCQTLCTQMCSVIKYKCSGSSCVRDDVNGTYTTSNCNNACACLNGANNPPTCNTCTAPLVWNGSSCSSAPTVDLKVNGSDNPPAVNAPANLTVSWTTTNSSQISGDCTGTGQGWSGPKNKNGGSDSGGSLNNIPAGTYTYSISCNPTDSVTITVLPAVVTAPGGLSLSLGGGGASAVTCNSVPLSWTTSSGATAYRILRGSPRIDISPYQPYTALNFTDTSVSQNTTYPYQIEAYNSGGTNRSNTINVSTPYCSPTLNFSADRTSIWQGQNVTLSWSTSYVTSCTASGAWSGSKALSGSQVVIPLPPPSVTYNLQCSGPGGSVSSSIIINITSLLLPDWHEIIPR